MSEQVRCVDPQCTDGPRDEPLVPAARWSVGGWLCRRCADLLEQRIAELPARRDQLRATLAGHRGGGGERRGSGDLAVPLDLGTYDHLQQLHAVLTSWVRLVCDERGLRGPDRNDVAVLAPWLLGQFDWLLLQSWVGDLADEMRDLARRADGLTRVHAGRHGLEPPCPSCGARELGRWDGDSAVACQSCGSCWTEEGYRRLVLVLASDSDLSVDARGAAHLLGVQVATVRQWVARGLLRRAGVIDGQPRYATAALREFAASRPLDEATRTGA